MSNKDIYKGAFSKLHASREFSWESFKMKENNKMVRRPLRCKRKLVVVIAVLVMIFAMTCAVNAATGGKILNNVKLFINGESVDANLHMNEDGSVIVEMIKGDEVKVTSDDEGSSTQVESYYDGKSDVTVSEDESSLNIN